MAERTTVEFFCTHCGCEGPHEVLVTEGRQPIEARCLRCGAVTPMRIQSFLLVDESGRKRPTLAFGGAELGGGRVLVEGTVIPDEATGGGAPVSTAERVALARRLKEAGAQYLRLPLRRREDLKSVGPVFEAARLPVLADVGSSVKLALEAGASGASGVMLTCSGLPLPEGTAALVRELGDLPLFLRVVPHPPGDGAGTAGAARAAGAPGPARAAGEAGAAAEPDHRADRGAAGALAQEALAVVRELRGLGARTPVLSVVCPDLPLYIEVNRILRLQPDLLIRLEYSPASAVLFPGLLRSGVGMGALLAEGVGDAVSLYLPGHAVGSVEATVEILAALGYGPGGLRPWTQSRSELVAYYTGKALFRLLTKAQRLTHEAEADLAGFARSLPLRLLSKPYRLLKELQHAARKIG